MVPLRCTRCTVTLGLCLALCLLVRDIGGQAPTGAAGASGGASGGAGGGASGGAGAGRSPIPLNYDVGHSLGFSRRAASDKSTPSHVTPDVVARLRREASAGKKGMVLATVVWGAWG